MKRQSRLLSSTACALWQFVQEANPRRPSSSRACHPSHILTGLFHPSSARQQLVILLHFPWFLELSTARDDYRCGSISIIVINSLLSTTSLLCFVSYPSAHILSLGTAAVPLAQGTHFGCYSDGCSRTTPWLASRRLFPQTNKNWNSSSRGELGKPGPFRAAHKMQLSSISRTFPLTEGTRHSHDYRLHIVQEPEEGRAAGKEKSMRPVLQQMSLLNGGSTNDPMADRSTPGDRVHPG